MPPVTLTTLRKMKDSRERFACLTAYDATFAHLLSAAGIEVLLVGDSLGMVIQGARSTVPVTLEDILYHTRCVAAGNQNALVMADLPYMTYAFITSAFWFPAATHLVWYRMSSSVTGTVERAP